MCSLQETIDRCRDRFMRTLATTPASDHRARARLELRLAYLDDIEGDASHKVGWVRAWERKIAVMPATDSCRILTEVVDERIALDVREAPVTRPWLAAALSTAAWMASSRTIARVLA